MRPFSVRRVYLCVLVLTAAGSAVLAVTVLSQLGVSETRARQDLVYALSTGLPSLGEAPSKALRAASPAVRAQLATGFIAWAKAYTATAEFKSSYAALRAERKPDAPELASADEAVKRQQAEQAKQADEMKKMLAGLPADQRAAMEASMKQMMATLEQQQKDPTYQKLMREAATAEYQEQKARYDRRMAEWQTNFPADPNALLATRIKSFLDVSATVDFNAKLVSANGRMRFADERYEGQSQQWKLCFRAGKETIDAARIASAAWLKELQR